MIESKLFDKDPKFKEFINKLKTNIVTLGTGIGKYNITYDKRTMYLSCEKEVHNIHSETFYEYFIINIDDIKAAITTQIFDGNAEKKELQINFNNYVSSSFAYHPKINPKQEYKISIDNILKEVQKHEEIPRELISSIVINNCILTKETMIEIKKVLPDLRFITIYNSEIKGDCYFNIHNNLYAIQIQDSLIESMRAFNGTQAEVLHIETSKVKKRTTEHLTYRFKTITISKTGIHMPTFIINTDMPDTVELKVKKKSKMNNIDTVFLTVPAIKELTYKARVSNVEFLKRSPVIEKVNDIDLDITKDPNVLRLFKVKLQNKINQISKEENYKPKWLDELLNELKEDYAHLGEEGYKKTINSCNFRFYNYIYNWDINRFYEFIKIIYDPMNFKNWIYKSRSNNLEQILEELRIVENMPYELRLKIGKSSNYAIEVPKPGDFIDILKRVREKSAHRNNFFGEPLINNETAIYDEYGNIINDYEKRIYSNTYDVLSEFEREEEYKKRKKLERIIKQFVPCESQTLSYLFRHFKGVLLSAAEKIVDDEKEGIKKENNRPTGEMCPECGNPLVYKNSRYGVFISCGNYPKCKYAKETYTGDNCPKCDNPLLIKQGPFGKFISCSSYPDCKYTKSLPKQEKKLNPKLDKFNNYDVLLSKYIEEALDILYEHQERIYSFTSEDYKKIKDSMPKIYEEVYRFEYETFIFICMVCKYITGKLPPMVIEAFSNIKIPKEVVEADKSKIIKVVLSESVKDYGERTKSQQYTKKEKRYPF